MSTKLPKETPRLQNVTISDLRDVARIECLRREAIMLKIIKPGPVDRLRFHALAASALRVARNPAAMFASNLYHRRFDLVAGVDEASAQESLSKFDRNA